MSSAVPKKVIAWGDLGVRILSALIMIPLALAADWGGGWWFHLFVVVLLGAVAYEWCAIVFPRNLFQLLLFISSVVFGVFATEVYGVSATFLALIFIAALSLALISASTRVWTFPWVYVGIFYVGLPAMALVLLRNDTQWGDLAILWIFIIVWSADILAYFAGRLIGGPKLAPRISPNKTWAGLAGAIVGSAFGSLAFCYFVGISSMLTLALIAGLLAIVEQGGDLFESALKRHYGVKDSGHIIPGHGGVMDRIDGLISVAVMAAIIGALHQSAAHAAAGLMIW